MPRRQITAIVNQQRRAREVARVRFGTRKPNEKRPGSPIQFPRVTGTDRNYISAVAAVYGAGPEDVLRWDREDRRQPDWEVTCKRPLAITVPPVDLPYTMAYERWSRGYPTVKCDGLQCQTRQRGRWVEGPCACAQEAKVPPEELEPEDRKCARVLRFSVLILGVESLGLARIDTSSYYAGDELPGLLELLWRTGGTGYLRMEMRERRGWEWDEKEGADKPAKRNFPVIVLDVPQLPEDLLQLERPKGMDELNVPPRKALVAGGERPQLGTGVIDPRPPQPGDRPAPPREVPPVDLSHAAPPPVSAPAPATATEPHRPVPPPPDPEEEPTPDADHPDPPRQPGLLPEDD